jgi:hypothetical protein
LHDRGNRPFRSSKKISAPPEPERPHYKPIGFPLTAVPKCFDGETFALYREEERKRQESERALRLRQETEIEQWRREQEAVLNDPNASEDDKSLARRTLSLD